MQRPIGITILAILAIIGGILSILAGIAQLAPGAMAFGVVSLVLGVLYLVYGFGLWQLKGWAWLLAVVVNALSVINFVVQVISDGFAPGRIVSLVISVLILVYLFSASVRKAFGRA